MQSTNSQINNPSQPINQSAGNSTHEHDNQLTVSHSQRTSWRFQSTNPHIQSTISEINDPTRPTSQPTRNSTNVFTLSIN